MRSELKLRWEKDYDDDDNTIYRSQSLCDEETACVVIRPRLAGDKVEYYFQPEEMIPDLPRTGFDTVDEAIRAANVVYQKLIGKLDAAMAGHCDDAADYLNLIPLETVLSDEEIDQLFAILTKVSRDYGGPELSYRRN